jgi:hypothetical protein
MYEPALRDDVAACSSSAFLISRSRACCRGTPGAPRSCLDLFGGSAALARGLAGLILRPGHQDQHDGDGCDRNHRCAKDGNGAPSKPG